MGRTTKLADDLVTRRVCEALEKGHTRAGAATLAGIGPSTMREWCARGRRSEEPFTTFLAATKRAEAVAQGRLLGIIEEAAASSWQAAAWMS